MIFDKGYVKLVTTVMPSMMDFMLGNRVLDLLDSELMRPHLEPTLLWTNNNHNPILTNIIPNQISLVQ